MNCLFVCKIVTTNLLNHSQYTIYIYIMAVAKKNEKKEKSSKNE